MKIYLIIALFLMAILVVACGGKVTGKAIVDMDEPEEADADEEENTEEEHIIMEGPTEEEKKFAEIYDGRDCEEDSTGIVRVFENDKKYVYRNGCFGDILIDYGCEKGQLTSENVKCPDRCAIDKYGKGYCS